MAAPAVTPAVQALTAVLEEAVANSRIIAALDRIIGQTLGLLVDLILLPFLPILIWVLKGLLSWVVDFGKWWNDFWKGSGKTLIDGIVALGDAIAGGIGALVDIGVKLGGALLDLGVGFLKWLWQAATGAASAVIDFAFKAPGAVYELLSWVWGIATKGTDIAMDILFNKIPGAVGDLLDWLWEIGTGVTKFLSTLEFDIPEPIKSILSWLKDIAGGVVSFTVEVTSKAVGDVAGAVGGAVGGAFGGMLDFLKSIGVPFLASGGVISETGIAVVHKGETVVPSGAMPSITITGTLFRDEEDMYQRVFDRIRAELWRQNV